MVNLSTSGNSIIFTFQDNQNYLQNGTIEVPKNSLMLVTDSSNMATFKKSASNDIFISALYSELGMTKSELENWFKTNATTSGGGGGITSGEVETMIDASISGKADSVSAVSSAEYVSSSTTINFKNIDGTVISSIDASDFVIDGMIEDVRIETLSGASYLVIDFNTESGKEDIQIPLTDIFDPSNYYNKQEVDNLVSAATDDMATQTWVGEQGYITGVDLSNYAEISAVTAVNNALTAHTSDDEIHVNGESKQYWDSKSDFSGSYNDLTDKPTIPTVPTSNTAFTNDAGYITADALNGYAESSAVTEEITAAVSGKQDTLIAGDNITISGNVISASGGGNNVIEVTQAEYDALVSAGTLDLTALYVISDAAAINVSGFVATSAITTAVTSASTNDEIPSALAVYAATSGGSGGGGSTYTAGRGISIDTANTISFSLPIYSGTGAESLRLNNQNFVKVSGTRSITSGYNPEATKDDAICLSTNSASKGVSSAIVGGRNNNINGNYSFIGGGLVLTTNNVCEFATGTYNVSNTGSTDADRTLFSVGNGTASNARHNAFEIRQNGDIYISSGGTDIKLQDNLGGGDASSAVTSGDTNAVQGGAVFEQLGGLKFVSLTQTEYNNLQNKDANTLYIITSPTPTFGGLTVYYFIQDPTIEVSLFNGGGSSSESEGGDSSGGGGALPTTMVVDGVSETPINTWRFETAGEHIVQYGFENNEIPYAFMQDIGYATKIEIGNDIATIPDETADGKPFGNMADLTSVTISDSITSIGYSAFDGCFSLERITVEATTPPTLGNNAFASTNSCPIYVPASVVDEYKASTSTGWSEYASRIQAIQ